MAERKTTKSTAKKTTSRASTPKTSSRFGGLNSYFKKVTRKQLITVGAVALIIIFLFVFRGLFIAATVNGEPISRLEIIQELENQSGSATLDRVITQKLILQEAQKRNINVTEEDIDKEVGEIEAQFREQGQDLNQLLETQGLSKERFRDEVEIQVIVERILSEESKVTDEEFNQFLEQNADLLEAEENQEEARARFREQLEQQKLAQKYQEWVSALKQNAKINHFVSY